MGAKRVPGKRSKPEVGDVTVTILTVAAEMLEAGGLDGLQLRDVAAKARVSLSTVYKHYPSRDELVISAVEHWMAANVYGQLTERGPTPHLADELIAFLREFFTPWSKHPKMLTVFLQAALLSGGDRLAAQGLDATRPSGSGIFDRYDPEFSEEVQTILALLTEGLLKRFSAGQMSLDQILDVYERAVRRLTAGVEPIPAAAARPKVSTAKGKRAAAGSRR